MSEKLTSKLIEVTHGDLVKWEKDHHLNYKLYIGPFIVRVLAESVNEFYITYNEENFIIKAGNTGQLEQAITTQGTRQRNDRRLKAIQELTLWLEKTMARD